MTAGDLSSWQVRMLSKSTRSRQAIRMIMMARVRAIEHNELLEAAIRRSRNDRELRAALAQPPLSLHGREVDAALALSAADRREPHRAVSLRRLLAELDGAEAELDRIDKLGGQTG